MAADREQRPAVKRKESGSTRAPGPTASRTMQSDLIKRVCWWRHVDIARASLMISVLTALVGASWVFTNWVRDSDLAIEERRRAVLEMCSAYRVEVIDLHDRGLSDEAIVRVLDAVEVTRSDGRGWDDEIYQEPSSTGLAEDTGTVESITGVLPENPRPRR